MSLTLVLSVVRWKRPELVRSNIAHRLLAANSLPKTTIFPLRSWLGLGTELKMRAAYSTGAPEGSCSKRSSPAAPRAGPKSSSPFPRSPGIHMRGHHG